MQYGFLCHMHVCMTVCIGADYGVEKYHSFQTLLRLMLNIFYIDQELKLEAPTSSCET